MRRLNIIVSMEIVLIILSLFICFMVMNVIIKTIRMKLKKKNIDSSLC